MAINRQSVNDAIIIIIVISLISTGRENIQDLSLHSLPAHEVSRHLCAWISKALRTRPISCLLNFQGHYTTYWVAYIISNAFFQNPRGRTMFPLKALAKNPSLPRSFWWFLAVLGAPWLIRASNQFLPPSSHGCLPFLCLRVSSHRI